MVDLEVVPIADAPQHRPEDRLVDVLDALAAGADEMVVVLRHAGDVGGDVTRSLQALGHACLDLRLERSIDGGEPQARMGAMQSGVELLG